MEWNIVVDSSCDLLSDYSDEQIGLDIVPLTIVVGEKYFRDDENVNTKDLLRAMKQEKRASSSACPSPRDFYSCFVKAENSICITMTGDLSGTYNAARLGAEMAKEEFPDKNIFVLDSKATAGKMVLLKNKAIRLIKSGMEFDDVCRALEEYNRETHLVFALGGYDNLVKTGRMSRLAGVMATHLGIRAVAVATDGQVDVVRKPRGERNAIDAMIEIMRANKDMAGKPVVISHCNNPVGAREMKLAISQRLKTDDVTILDCRGLTTFYTMEKGLIVGY